MSTNIATKKCDVTPDISLMKKMASISGTIPSRLMELVDNSIDAKIPSKVLEIDVNVIKRGKKQYIEVIDNGHGMTEDIAKSFFRLGDSKKTGKKNIGKFGLGAKVAILGIGNTSNVTTSPIGKSYFIDTHFDIQTFKDWNINYDVKEARNYEHGTRIRIDNLTIRIGNVKRFTERLHEHFSKTYKHFIENDDVVLRINGQKVKTIPTDLITDLYKEFEFTISSGKKVRGWAGAMKKAGINWKFGFDLISNGRIIKANDLLNRHAHQSLSRLTGEIHLDDFETDVHKTDFLRDTHDFQEMQMLLVEDELSEVITKIAKLTNKEVFNKYHKDMVGVSNTLNRVIRSYDFLNNIDIDEGLFKKLKTKAEKNEELKDKRKDKKEKTTKEETDVLDEMDEELVNTGVEEKEESKKTKTKRSSGLVITEPLGVSLGEEQPPRRWMVEEVENGVSLGVEVNMDHPTYQIDNDESVAVYMKNAVLDSVAEFILQEEKAQTGLLEDEIDRLNRIKDMLIRYSLSV